MGTHSGFDPVWLVLGQSPCNTQGDANSAGSFATLPCRSLGFVLTPVRKGGLLAWLAFWKPAAWLIVEGKLHEAGTHSQ